MFWSDGSCSFYSDCALVSKVADMLEAEMGKRREAEGEAEGEREEKLRNRFAMKAQR